MAKYENPAELDYRNGGDTVDDFAQKYMRTVDYIIKALNDLRTPTGNTAGVEPEPYMWRIADNKLYIRNADNTDYILLGDISPNFGFRQSVNDQFITTADLEREGTVVVRDANNKVTGDITGSPDKIADKPVDVTPTSTNDILAYDATQQAWIKKTLNDYLKKTDDPDYDDLVAEIVDQVITDITPVIFNYWRPDAGGYLTPLGSNVIAPQYGSTNNSVGAADRKWKEGHFEKLPNWQEYLVESTGYGIVSGCAPSISGLTVTVGAGVVHLADGTRKEIAETNITLDNADPTNPRIDLVYINADGEVAKVTGTAAADPAPAILSKNCIGLCIVEIPANSTTGVIKLRKSNSLVDSYTWAPQFRRTYIPATRNDATVYDGKMFYAPGDDGVLKVYDIRTNSEIANVTLSGGYKPHGNTICFGKKRNNADTYPLLYITGYNGLDSNNNVLPHGTCFVYKINDDFSNDLVQVITIGFTSDDLWTTNSSLNMPISIGTIGYGNFIVDTDRNRLIVFTDTNFTTRFFEFEIPNLSTSNVTLQQADIVENWDIPLLPWPQGTAIKDGKIYAVHGIEEASSFVSVIDLDTKAIISNIDVSHFTAETEGVFFIDDRLFVNGTTKYHEVINYKKVDAIGALSSLQTTRNSSIVEAINSACYSGQALEAFTTGPAGRCKFLLITVYADENEDLKQPIKDAILNSQQYDNHTEIFFFHGLCSAHNGQNYGIITGFYQKTSTNMYFEWYPFVHREQAMQFAYNGTDFYKTNLNDANFVGEGRTNNLFMGGNQTRYITLREHWTTVLVDGNYGTKGVLRQIVLAYNTAETTAYDDLPITITVQALGNNKFSITTGDSISVMLHFNKMVTVSNTI